MLQIFADYHTHTVHSHGSGSVADNVRAARRAGLDEVGISDHGPANLFGVGVRSAQALLDIRDEVRELDARLPDIRVFVGVEANVTGIEGTLDVPREVLEELDYVMVGLHWLVRPAGPADGLRLLGLNLPLVKRIGAVDRRARIDNTKALVAAVRRYDVDVVTHPGLRLAVDTAELARACARRGTALEINAGHRGLTVDYIKTAARWGVEFVIGSDAHRPEDVGRFERARALVERAGLDPASIRNARPAGKRPAVTEEAKLKKPGRRKLPLSRTEVAAIVRATGERHPFRDHHRDVRRREDAGHPEP